MAEYLAYLRTRLEDIDKAVADIQTALGTTERELRERPLDSVLLAQRDRLVKALERLYTRQINLEEKLPGAPAWAPGGPTPGGVGTTRAGDAGAAAGLGVESAAAAGGALTRPARGEMGGLETIREELEVVKELVLGLDKQLKAVTLSASTIEVTPSKCSSSGVQQRIESAVSLRWEYKASTYAPCCYKSCKPWPPPSKFCWGNRTEDAKETIVDAIKYLERMMPAGVKVVPVQSVDWLSATVHVGAINILIKPSRTDYLFVLEAAWEACKDKFGAKLENGTLKVTSGSTAEALLSMLDSVIGLYEAKTDRALNSNQNQPRVQALLEYLAINNMLRWPSIDVVVAYGDLNRHHVVHAGRNDAGEPEMSIHVAVPGKLCTLAEHAPAVDDVSPESSMLGFVRALLGRRATQAGTGITSRGAGEASGSGGGAAGHSGRGTSGSGGSAAGHSGRGSSGSGGGAAGHSGRGSSGSGGGAAGHSGRGTSGSGGGAAGHSGRRTSGSGGSAAGHSGRGSSGSGGSAAGHSGRGTSGSGASAAGHSGRGSSGSGGGAASHCDLEASGSEGRGAGYSSRGTSGSGGGAASHHGASSGTRAGSSCAESPRSSIGEGQYDRDEGLEEAARENAYAQLWVSVVRTPEAYHLLGLTQPPTSITPPSREECIARFRPL